MDPDIHASLKRFLEIDSPYDNGVTFDLPESYPPPERTTIHEEGDGAENAGRAIVLDDDISHYNASPKDEIYSVNEAIPTCRAGSNPSYCLNSSKNLETSNVWLDLLMTTTHVNNTELIHIDLNSNEALKQDLLTTSSDKVQSSSVSSRHHDHQALQIHQWENFSQIEAWKPCNEQDSIPNDEGIVTSECGVALQDSKLYALSLVRAVNKNQHWACEEISGSDRENMFTCYKGKEFAEQTFLQHPPPWMISTHWAPTLLMECARSIAVKETERVNHLLWVLKSLASPKDDSLDCRLASYFVHGLQCKVGGTGRAVKKALNKALHSIQLHFNNSMKIILTWREVSPWVSFGHVAANAALLEAFEGEQNVHVVDVSHWTYLCVQWPTLLEALARRSEGPPHFRLTVVLTKHESTIKEVMREVGNKITRFARLMGLPFELNVLHEPAMEKLNADVLGVRPGEALAVNLNQSLHSVPTKASKHGLESPRDMALQTLHSNNPKIVVVIEDEVDQVSSSFADRFSEMYRFISVFLGSLDRPDMVANQRRLDVQERAVRLMIVKNIACDEDDDDEQPKRQCNHGHTRIWEGIEADDDKREHSSGWSRRLRRAGFDTIPLGEDLLHNVRVLLNLYSPQWGLRQASHHKGEACPDHSPNSLTLTWRGYPTNTFTAWRAHRSTD